MLLIKEELSLGHNIEEVSAFTCVASNSFIDLLSTGAIESVPSGTLNRSLMPDQ